MEVVVYDLLDWAPLGDRNIQAVSMHLEGLVQVVLGHKSDEAVCSIHPGSDEGRYVPLIVLKQVDVQVWTGAENL